MQPKQVYLVMVGLIAFSMATPYAVFTLFLLQHLPATLVGVVTMLNVIHFIWLEVPTGTIADRYGPKASSVAGCFILGIGLGMYSIGSSFLVFAFTALIVATGLSLISGALDTWVVRIDPANKITTMKQERFAKLVFALPGIFMSGFLAQLIGLNGVFIFSGIIAILTGFFGTIMMEYVAPSPQQTSSRVLARKALTFVTRSGSMRSFIIASGLIECGVMAYGMLWSPVFVESFGLGANGPIGLAIQIATIIGVVWISRSVKISPYLAIRAVALSGIVIAVGVFNSQQLILLITFLIVSAFLGVLAALAKPLINSVIPEDTDTEMGATVRSYVSIAEKLGSALGGLATGMIAAQTQFQYVWLFALIPLGIGAIFYWRGGQSHPDMLNSLTIRFKMEEL